MDAMVDDNTKENIHISGDSKTMLTGLEAIAEYLNWGVKATRQAIKEEGLPACKILKSWVSDRILIKKWVLERIEKETREAKEEAE